MFDYVIAETLGMSVERVHETISTEELAGWQAFFWARSVHRESQQKRAAEAAKMKTRRR